MQVLALKLLPQSVLPIHAIALCLRCFLSAELWATVQLLQIPDLHAHPHAPLATLLRLQE